MKPTVFVVVISFNDPVKVFIAHLKSGSKRACAGGQDSGSVCEV